MQDTTATPANDSFAALRQPQFRAFLVGRFCAITAIMMQATIISWMVYDITRNPLDLGLLGLTEFVPAICVALFGGHLADRLNRRSIIITLIAIFLLLAIALVFFALNKDYFYQTKQAWPLYTAIFITGFCRGFLGPAIFSFQSQLVPKSMFGNAMAWNSAFWNVGAIGGPALGGFVYGYRGPAETYVWVAVLFVIALVAFFSIPAQPVPPVDKSETIFQSLQVGLRFVFGHRIVLAALAIDMFAVLFGGATALLPVFANDILKVGPEGLGYLRGAPFLGAVVVSGIMAARKPMRRAGMVLLLCVAAYALCMIAFALSTNFYLSVFILFLSGAFDGVSVVLRGIVLQLYTPDNMRGRVASVNTIFIVSSNEIGAFESGVAAKLMGTVPSVIFGGLISLVVVGVAYYKAKELRTLNLRNELNA
jgi:MFS family permease